MNLTNLKTYLTNQAGAGCTQAGKLLAEVREWEKLPAGYDLSNVMQLTHHKAKAIIERDGYTVTGFVLTHNAGSKCIVDHSAVRWFAYARDFGGVMHDNTVRYCPECGSAGEVSAGHRDCCPDGIRARRIPSHIAAHIHQIETEYRAMRDAAPKPEASDHFPDATKMVAATDNFPHDDMGRETA